MVCNVCGCKLKQGSDGRLQCRQLLCEMCIYLLHPYTSWPLPSDTWLPSSRLYLWIQTHLQPFYFVPYLMETESGLVQYYWLLKLICETSHSQMLWESQRWSPSRLNMPTTNSYLYFTATTNVNMTVIITFCNNSVYSLWRVSNYEL